jgi:hypothetical protein
LRQSTEPRKNTWLARCRYDDCDEEKVICPVCKKPGHVTTHMVNNSKPYVQICILHSHFLENIDAGRNMFCETGMTALVTHKGIKTVVRLLPQAKRQLINEFVKRFKK